MEQFRERLRLEDAIDGHLEIDFTKKLVICCSRGEHSVEVAETLEEKGVDAVSLNGGYIAWLIDTMKQKRRRMRKKK